MKKLIIITRVILGFIFLAEVIILMRYQLFSIRHLVIIAGLLFLLSYKIRLTWGALIILCCYGLYNMIVEQPIYSFATNMNFTGTLHGGIISTFDIPRNNSFMVFLWNFPILFYLFLGIVLFITSVRDSYWK